jgi:hypothetical protein
VKLAIDKDARHQVFLSPNTKFPIFIQDLPIKSIDIFELLVGGVFMSVYFILDFACGRCDGDHALNVKEFITNSSVFVPKSG